MCNFTSFLHYGLMIGLYILYVILFKYTFFFFLSNQHNVMNVMGPVVSQYSREMASRIPMDPNLWVAKSFAV